MTSDKRRILDLFKDGDRALIAADVAELLRIYADDYVQYDESGTRSKRKDLVRKLRSKEIQFLAMKATGRSIRLLRKDVALVHGSEEDVIEKRGKRRHVKYGYLDVVMKRGGRWQIVASQLVKLP